MSMRCPGYEITLALQSSLLRCGVEALEDMQYALREVFANAKCQGQLSFGARQDVGALKDGLADEFDSLEYP